MGTRNSRTNSLVFTVIIRCLVMLAASSSMLLSESFSSFVSTLERTPVDRRARMIETFLKKIPSFPIIESDTLIHFVYYGTAGVVEVNGNLQRWNDPDSLFRIPCGEKTFFYRTYAVPPDARLDYQLVVDGTYQLDPLNLSTTPSGYGLHSEIRMPKFIPSPFLVHRDTIPQGTLEEIPLYHYLRPPLSRYMLPARSLYVYLPPGYDTLRDLPTVYINDGVEAINFAGVPTMLDNLIAQKRIDPLIAVFIPPVNRQTEYLMEWKDKFVAVVCTEIVPMIDRKYSTAPRPAMRAMMGISSGGHLALYAVMNRPDIFHCGGGQSPTISPDLIRVTQEQADRGILTPAMKIYIDCGRYDIQRYHPVYGQIDFLESSREYSEMLATLRVPHFFREVNDGHEWASWRERMPDMFIFFFGRYR